MSNGRDEDQEEELQEEPKGFDQNPLVPDSSFQGWFNGSYGCGAMVGGFVMLIVGVGAYMFHR